MLGLARIALLTLTLLYTSEALKECSKKETTYSYTACDHHGERWRVKVPTNSSHCQIETAEVTKGKDCGFECGAGQFLNIEKESCESCPNGTFSVGENGVRFYDWSVLPQGFTYSSESLTLSDFGYETKVKDCSESTWHPAGNYIVSNTDDCASKLSYLAQLKSDGNISFEYQHTDSDMLFHFYIQNKQCKTLHDPASFVFLNTTGPKWGKWEVSLPRGTYLLHWSVNGILLDNSPSLNPVKISVIQITGVESSTEETCHPCLPGFYSSGERPDKCLMCPINTWSDAGADHCEPCDVTKQYSSAGSSKCVDKPPCSKKDYFVSHSACDENLKMNSSYKWVEPQTCLPQHPDSIHLPQSLYKDCAPCNPGFYPSNELCIPCPTDEYSSGTEGCEKCPANTEANVGLWYIYWNELPDTMESSCSEPECSYEEVWIADKDKLRTVEGYSGDGFLILILMLKDGFRKLLGGRTYGQLKFEFELECKKECKLIFMKNLGSEDKDIIKYWSGTQNRQIFTFDVTTNSHDTSFTWAFRKDNYDDVATIYSLNVTNVADGVADGCNTCSLKKDEQNECIPCPPGHHLVDGACTTCPPDTILDEYTYNEKSCVTCNNGTRSNNEHTRCQSDCIFHSSTTGRSYNFSKVPPSITVSTRPGFSSKSRMYNYIFNISLCNNEGYGVARCSDNLTSSYSNSGSVTGMICRSTRLPVPSIADQEVEVLSQSTLIADELVEINQENFNQSSNHTTTTNKPFPKDLQDDLNDVIFHMRYNDDNFLYRCPNGKHVYIHMRCDPLSTQDRILIDSDCPDATCDGCEFNFLWRSIHACPLCTEDDYESVTSSCTNDVKKVKYIWKNYPPKCQGGVNLPKDTEDHCVDAVRVTILIILPCIPIMAILILVMYRKNRNIEYKYHKLVLKSGQLPPSDSCALNESDSDRSNDEEDDKIIFQRKKSKSKAKSNGYSDSTQLLSTDGV